MSESESVLYLSELAPIPRRSEQAAPGDGFRQRLGVDDLGCFARSIVVVAVQSDEVTPTAARPRRPRL